VLERAYSFMQATGEPFKVALAATRAGSLFTTHTAVEAGFDRFEPALIEQYLGGYATQKLGITLRDLLALGRADPRDSLEAFNMAYLALRGSGAVNGVSRLHAQVSRQLFTPLFPRWPEEEIPVDHVTNGVHMPTWDSAAADALWTEACGKDRWQDETVALGAGIRAISDERLWQFRSTVRSSLVAFARVQLSRRLTAAGAPREAIAQAQGLFNPEALTLGFARRFVLYKRPNLLMHDPERLLRLLSNSERPVQLIIAGKAHPADVPGQALIQQWVQFIRQARARPHIIFLSDYDMLLTEHLVQGVDVWINTPRRPWEACGTSGMKTLVNGGLNLSELDGWWAEAFTPDVGWALGDGREHPDEQNWDAAEANQLYERLEREVIPEFYTRDERGIPRAWVKRIRESMAKLTPRFSASRTVREYTERYYVPAAEAFRSRTADKGAAARELAHWQDSVGQKWGGIHFGTLRSDTVAAQHVFELEVYLNGLDKDAVRVELYAEPSTAWKPRERKCTVLMQAQTAQANASTALASPRLVQ
jgi:starch phosphorylase